MRVKLMLASHRCFEQISPRLGHHHGDSATASGLTIYLELAANRQQPFLHAKQSKTMWFFRM